MDTKEEKRTDQQNRAMHKFYELLAEALNNGGYTVQIVLHHQMAVSWTKTLIKEIIWKAAQRVQLGKESTTQLTKKEVDAIYDEVNNYTTTNFGVHVDFPHIPDPDIEYKEND